MEKLSKSKNTKSILEDMKKDLEHAKASAAEQLRKAEERETHMREASRRTIAVPCRPLFSRPRANHRCGCILESHDPLAMPMCGTPR